MDTSVRSAREEQQALEALHRLDEECVHHQRASDYLRAFDCMERALVLRRHFFGLESDEVALACRALAEMCNLLAMSFLQQDNLPVAVDLLKKAEVLTAQHGQRFAAERATTLNNLACYYRRLGKLHAALASLRAAVAIERRLGRVGNAADTLLNLCAVLSQLGKHEQALAHAQEALLVLQEDVVRPSAAGAPPLDRVSVMCIAYHNVGVEQEFLKAYDESVQSYKKGVGLAEQYLGPDHSVTTTVRNSYLAAKRSLSTKPKQRPASDAYAVSPGKGARRLLSSPRGKSGGSPCSSPSSLLRMPSPLAKEKQRQNIAQIPTPRSIVADALSRKSLPPLEPYGGRDAGKKTTDKAPLTPTDPFFSPRYSFSDGEARVEPGPTAAATASPERGKRAASASRRRSRGKTTTDGERDAHCEAVTTAEGGSRAEEGEEERVNEQAAAEPPSANAALVSEDTAEEGAKSDVELEDAVMDHEEDTANATESSRVVEECETDMEASGGHPEALAIESPLVADLGEVRGPEAYEDALPLCPSPRADESNTPADESNMPVGESQCAAEQDAAPQPTDEAVEPVQAAEAAVDEPEASDLDGGLVASDDASEAEAASADTAAVVAVAVATESTTSAQDDEEVALSALEVAAEAPIAASNDDDGVGIAGETVEPEPTAEESTPKDRLGEQEADGVAASHALPGDEGPPDVVGAAANGQHEEALEAAAWPVESSVQDDAVELHEATTVGDCGDIGESYVDHPSQDWSSLQDENASIEVGSGAEYGAEEAIGDVSTGEGSGDLDAAAAVVDGDQHQFDWSSVNYEGAPTEAESGLETAQGGEEGVTDAAGDAYHYAHYSEMPFLPDMEAATDRYEEGGDGSGPDPALHYEQDAGPAAVASLEQHALHGVYYEDATAQEPVSSMDAEQGAGSGVEASEDVRVLEQEPQGGDAAGSFAA